MGGEANRRVGELQRKLDDRKSEMYRKLPTKMAEAVREATADLIRSGLAERTLREGAQAPDFALPDGSGEIVRLSEVRARGPVVLVFFRGVWCPFCSLQLQAYQQVLPQIRALGATLLAVSPQTTGFAQQTAEKHELKFGVLADGGNRVARQFGLVFAMAEAVRKVYANFGINLPAYNGDESYELPLPATYVVSEEGTIRLAFVSADYTQRLDPETVLDALRALGESKPSRGGGWRGIKSAVPGINE